MSSKVTGDAQPNPGIEADAQHTLPTEIVKNSTEASGPDETGDQAAVTGGAEAAAGTGSAEPAVAAEAEPATVEAADSAGTAAAESAAEPPAAEADAGPADAAEEADEEPKDTADLEEPLEPTELIAMAEPVELAEPVEYRRPRRRVWGVLIAFGFLLAAAAIVGGAFAIVGSLTHGFKKPVIIHYKKSAIFALKTGQCIDPNGQQAASVVACSTPHDAEVFATFSLSGSKWPGTTAVRAAASSGCSTRLTGYLNPQLAISLSSTYIYPDSVAWQAGTRTVICEVRATKGQLTGSVRGASATAS